MLQKTLLFLLKKYSNHPIFSIALNELKNAQIIITPNVDTARIFYNGLPIIEVSEDFYKKFIQSPADILFLLSHEILHYIFGDIFQSGYWNNYSPSILNIAQDIIINQFLYKHLSEPLSITDFYKQNPQYEECLNCLLLPINESIEQKKSECEKIRTYLLNEHTPSVLTVLEHIYLCHRHEVSNIKPLMIESTLNLRDKTYQVIRNEVKQIFFKDYFTTLTKNKNSSTINFLYEQLLEFCVTKNEHETYRYKEVGIVPFFSRRDIFFLSTDFSPVFYHNNYLVENMDSVVLYLDVSGSIEPYLEKIFKIIRMISVYIKYPIYGFSDEIFPITYTDLLLGKYKTTKGTDFNAIANHILKCRYKKVVLITDGYSSISYENANNLIKSCDVLTLLAGADNSDQTVQQFSKKILTLTV